MTLKGNNFYDLIQFEVLYISTTESVIFLRRKVTPGQISTEVSFRRHTRWQLFLHKNMSSP